MTGWRIIKGLGMVVVVITISLMSLSCKPRNKYIMNEKKLTTLLVDLHLAEAIGMQTQRGILNEYTIDSASLYTSVFNKHGVTRAMLDSTMYYYSLKPERLQKVINNVIAELKHREEDIELKMKEEDSISSEVIWKSDSVYVFPQRGSDRIEIDVPLKGTGIYTVTASVKLLPDDMSLDPRMTLYFYKFDGTPVGKRMHFPGVRYLSRNGEPRVYRAVKELDSLDYTHIRGTIANYSNEDTLFRRNMVVSEIKVMRRERNK
jgi:DNA-binding transcriptional ArsR family regulator